MRNCRARDTRSSMPIRRRTTKASFNMPVWGPMIPETRPGTTWGFDWATVAFVWDKVHVNRGFYTLSQCELCVAFKRGTHPAPAQGPQRPPTGSQRARSAWGEHANRRSWEPERERTASVAV